MASTKDLRKRIVSVKNTQQITKAMKMVSAAKLKRAQDAIVGLRPYAQSFTSLVHRLHKTQAHDNKQLHPLLKARLHEDEPSSLLLIVITSDRGLCGAFNTNVIKTVQRYLRTHAHKYEKLDLLFIGKKGFEFFKNKKTGKYFEHFFQGLKYKKAENFSQHLIQLYLSKEYDEIKFVYNEFKSAISQKVNVESFLPLRFSDNLEKANLEYTIYEPEISSIVDFALPKYFGTQVYRILLDSLASEHGARMAAMENATKNAGEMIRKITLLYNKTRQAGITKELLEIVSGTEAQKT